ncbi:guanine nucleotide exchange factor DCK1 ASCRUDRAFT_78986 [Ascoidea rubescens DSM 1968]|uniref:DOCKER domain-containing protein n=1 Tax=Ascoidea rubescens DSM 1968 TaxID=1344418 RepID=A0A1D2VQZ5_9ASCO|nr:hypothetical protein ASCRUDRAFT_78986 [Ascoidea rubescens DSM 1968]ODV64036.1 hypothetical protein ASCRUDRAFT_78986 [Ascoidea rubescens DSM 1968]
MLSKWSPLPMLAHGRIIKSFLPQNHLERLPPYYQNLYPGDEVYIFEINDNWARGYLLVQPLPTDFIAVSTNLEKLPDQRINVVIFPLTHVRILEKIPIPLNGGGLNDDQTLTYHMKPPLPALRLDSGDLLDEITPAISLLSSHIYSLYSVGEFNLSLKLGNLYYELDEIRIKLNYNLCTKAEKNLARKNASLLLSKIAKLLSSKGINRFDKTNSAIKYDVSGYEAIMSRDPLNGDLFDYNNSLLKSQATPDIIASNQLMYALCSNYPISDLDLGSLIPPPNNKFVRAIPSQILVDFKSVTGSSNLNPKGFAGMTCYMYLRNTRKRLTEAFAVNINNSQDFLLEHLSAALFRNIPSTEIDKGRIYLVALLTEEIDINILRNTNNQPNSLRRIRKGIAAGVTDISRIFSRHKGALASGESHQFIIKLFGSYINQNDTMASNGETNYGWGELVDRIIRGSNKGVAVNPRAERLIVSIKEFKNDLQTFINDFDTNGPRPISQIRTIYYDPLVKPYERIYLSLGKAHLNQTLHQSLPVTIQISTTNPSIHFTKGTNEKNRKNWQFVSVYSDESIGELIKISGIDAGLSINDTEYLTFFAYINGEIVADGKLLIRNKNKIVEYKKTHIVELASIQNSHNIAVTFELTTEYVGKNYNIDHAINTLLNWKTLINLPSNESNLMTIITKFNILDTSQLIKYFPELLKSLLEIYKASVDLNLPNLNKTIFEAIVHMLDFVVARQEQYVYLFEDFVDNTKNLPYIGFHLLSKMESYFSCFKTSWEYLNRSVCRVSTLILRLAILTTSQQTVEIFNRSWNEFLGSISSFLNSKDKRFTSDQSSVLEVIDLWLLSLRAIFIDEDILNFGIILIDSVGIRGLSKQDDFSSSAPSMGLTTKRNDKVFGFIITKLLLIRRLLHSWFVENHKCRDRLIITSINWAMEVLLANTDVEAARLANGILISILRLTWDIVKSNRTEDLYLCRGVSRLLPTICDILNNYNKFARTHSLFKPKRTFTPLFPSDYPFPEITMDSIVNDEVFVEVLIEMMTIFSYLSKIARVIAGPKGFLSILEESKADTMFVSQYFVQKITKQHILSLINTAKLLISSKCYPASKWLSLHAMVIESAVSSFELVKYIMEIDYIPSVDEMEQFDRSLWGNFLKTCLKFATAMPSSICHLAEVPRKACWKITGDVRNRCALLINEVWDALAWDALEEDIVRFQLKKFGGYQVEFINFNYGVLQDLMLFCMQRHSNCQILGVKMLHTIIISEWLLNGNFNEIEKECILGFYEIFHSNKYKPGQYEERNFIRRLKMSIKIDPEDEAFPAIDGLIQNLSEFLEVLNDLENVPEGPEFDDDRTFHKININGFLKHVDKPELLHSFINEMVEDNLSKTNFVQAGLSYQLLASTYNWNLDDKLPLCIKPKFPSQSSFERKETLYKMIAENFVKGNALEKAIDIYKELAQAYDTISYDFKGLSYVHENLSKLYLSLETVDRLTPAYFRISFIGYGFPKSVRARQFIYEGLPFEHITSIHDRLLRLHPGATIISNDEEAKQLYEVTPSGRYLHITTVEPQMNLPANVSGLTVGARFYLENRNLCQFTSARRLPGSTSVMDLWVEETTYETYTTFPTLMNRSEIKRAIKVKLSPLQNALRSLSSKTQELISLEIMANKAIKEKEDVNSIFGELSRQLAGTIDAPVNGGIGQYRVFFVNENFTKNSQYTSQLESLKHSFGELANTIQRCLVIHGKLVPVSLQESHLSLIKLFQKNFEEEINLLAEFNSHHPSANIKSNSAVNGGGVHSGSIQMLGGLSGMSSMNGNGINNGVNSSINNIGNNTNGINSLNGISVMNGINGIDYLNKIAPTESIMSTTTDSTGSRSTTSGSHKSAIAKRTVLNWRQSRNITE